MKLIITDLDNTLLRSDKNLSEYTAQVFEKCRQKGYLIAFATARSQSAAARFVNTIKPDVMISNGGAIVEVKGEVIYRNLMSGEDVSTILKMCRKFTNGQGLITLDCDRGYYCNFVPKDPDRYAGYVHLDFADFCEPSYKITAELEREEWGEEIAKACSNCTVISFTGEKWRRFAAKGSDKATALQILADYIGVDLRDVIAFGDDRNDLGMMELAGRAVAVSNAIDEVKAVADHIAGSNDQDGVASYIESVLLTEV